MKRFNKLRKKYGYEKAVKIVNNTELSAKIIPVLGVLSYSYVSLYVLEYALRNHVSILWAYVYATITMVVVVYSAYKITKTDEEIKYIKIENRIKNIESLLRNAGINKYKNELGNVKIEHNLINLKLTIIVEDKQLDLYNSGWSKYTHGIWDEEVYDFCIKTEEDIDNVIKGIELDKTAKIKEIENLYNHR